MDDKTVEILHRVFSNYRQGIRENLRNISWGKRKQLIRALRVWPVDDEGLVKAVAKFWGVKK
jgi:hypothetical protein